MRSARTIRNGLLGLAALAGGGCSITCTTQDTSTVSTANLTGSISSAEAASLATLQAGVGPSVDITSVSTELIADPSCPGGLCVDVVQLALPAIDLRFTAPPSTGTFDLADLQPRLCDEACGSPSGSVVVTKLVAPCADGSCGSLEATLTITSAGDGGPSITGTAALSFEQGLTTGLCPITGPPFPSIGPIPGLTPT